MQKVEQSHPFTPRLRLLVDPRGCDSRPIFELCTSVNLIGGYAAFDAVIDTLLATEVL